MDNISALTAIEMKVSPIFGGYNIIVLSEPNKKDNISNEIEDIISCGNMADITENLKKFTGSYGNENTEVFLFDNGKLCYCSLPSDEGVHDLTIVRNFGGVFRNEDGIIKGRGSVKMFPSLIATIPRKVASDNCIFIPTPAGIL